MRKLVSYLLATAMLAAFVPVAITAPVEAVAAPTEPKIGVIWTNTAYNCVNYSGYKLNSTTYTERVDAVQSILEAEFSDVTRIGDSTLNSLSALKQYDVIVAPRLLAMTGLQRQNIRSYVAEGGGLVGSFGVSRWDYTPGRTPHAYEPLITLWQFSDSWDNSRVWEWGEVSEVYQVKFANDPLTYGGYTIAAKPSSTHEILKNTIARKDVSTLTMKAKQADYNELVWTMPGNSHVTPLYTYANASTNDASYPANGTMAGWAADYYFGKLVYFGFQLHDIARSTYYADSTSMNTAKGLLLESVRWAGTQETYARVNKRVTLSATGWFTRGKLYVNQTVANSGEIQKRGHMRVYMYNPSGALVYSGTAKNQQIPLPPGGTYTYKSWQPYIGYSPQPGLWKVKCTYEYFDRLKNGTVTATRYLYMYSNGSSMWSQGMSAQSYSSGNLPVIGEQIAGSDRYSTSVKLSARGWPDGVGSSKAVILATGENFPDALAAAPLAGKLDAPVLLVKPTSVRSSVATELKRLYSGETSATIYVVGGESAVPNDVAEGYRDVLVGNGTTDVELKRLEGKDRYWTAYAIAKEVGTPQTGTFANTAFVVSGLNYPDALAISPLAAAESVPILPVKGSSVPSGIQKALQELDIQHTTILGDVGVVGSGVETYLESNGHRVDGVAPGAHDVDTRLGGSDRYDTGLLAVDFSLNVGTFDDSFVYMATGKNWPDALALAPLAGLEAHPLLLVYGTELGKSVSVAEYMIGRQDDAPSLAFVGGDSVVTPYVRGQIRVALDQ